MAFAFILYAAYCASYRKRTLGMIPIALDSLFYLALAALAWLIGTSTSYIFVSGYFDHCEPAVASLSWMTAAGGPSDVLAPDDAARYSFQYGPLVYLTNAVALILLGGSVASSKVMGVVSCTIGLLALYGALRVNLNRNDALTLTGFTALQFLAFANFSYWNRPDPFLILCSAIALLTLTRLPKKTVPLILGTLIGSAFALKIHGPLYVAPIVTAYIARRPRPLDLVLLAGAAAISAGLTFLMGNASITALVIAIQAASKHGLSLSYFYWNITYLIPVLLPLLVFALLKRGELRAESQIFVYSTCATLILITIPASKVGAGPHHYLPLIPIIIYAFSLALRNGGIRRLFSAECPWREDLITGFLISAVVVSLMSASLSQYRIARYLSGRWPYSEATLELNSIMARYPNQIIQMGYSDDAGYALTMVRPLLSFHGHPLFLDAAPLMDFTAAGSRLPVRTIDAMRTCKVSVWIIPRPGEPFSMTNNYPPHDLLFDRKLRSAFFESYMLDYSANIYDSWICKQAAVEK